jgi:hypothetical protein
MNIKIGVGDYEIIDSGTVIIDNGKDLTFQIEALKFVFRFEKDENTTGQYDKITLLKDDEEKDYLLITLFNFEDMTNMGNANLLSLATYKNRELSIKLRVNTAGDTSPDHIFNYSWYLSNKEVSDE